MKRARTGGGVLAVLGLAGALAMGSASAEVTDSPWTEVTHPHPANQSTYLYDTWTTGDEVWAVGTRRVDLPGAWEFRTWAQRCIGGVCDATYPRDFESPPYTNNSLQGISGTSASDVWAVGYGRMPNGITAGTTHHFDGVSWSVVANPVVNGALYGVSAVSVDDVWAVGEESGSAARVVLHWNGSGWTRVPFELAGSCVPSGRLSEVAAAAGRWPLVIGECRVGTAQPEPMVAAYKNGHWVRQHLQGVADEDDLYSVDWVGAQAWVAGRTYATGGTALAARWKRGAGWAATDTAGIAGSVNDIGGNRPKDVWAVGSNGCCYRMAMHWDGTAWTPDDAGEYGFLFGVTVTADGTPWSVGQEGSSSLILRRDGA